jgi:DNA-binding response OmpR family regulator
MTSRPALRVLVIEDNAVLRTNLEALFAAQGIGTCFAADGLSGLQIALDESFDVVVLDLGLPGMDGVRVCEQLRTRSERHMPILMLTARDALEDKLAGFRCGADDYLVKPFAGAELVARCLALSQRHRVGSAHELVVGSLRIDRRTNVVWREGQLLPLQHTALQLLLILAEAWPRTLTRSELVERLWGEHAPDSDPLRTHLYTLRQVLDKPFPVAMLRTVHGVGFRLEADR